MIRFFNSLVYYLIVIPISHLPFGILYVISDIIYFLIYYVVGYRKAVVRRNIKNAFPNYSDEKRKKIEKGFYKHFSDFLVENAKSISIKDKDIRKRCALVNPEILQNYYDQGKDVVVSCGHYNNWEYYAVGLAQQIPFHTVAVYKPLKNDFFNSKILKSRQRFGLQMKSMQSFPRFIAKKTGNQPTLSVTINDQSPSNPKGAYWNTFLNQSTGWQRGMEKISKKYNQVVVFGAIHKIKRGYYEVKFTPITENAKEEPEGAIIEQHSRLLENVIQEEPKYWLWSHRRWKHTPPS